MLRELAYCNFGILPKMVMIRNSNVGHVSLGSCAFCNLGPRRVQTQRKARTCKVLQRKNLKWQTLSPSAPDRGSCTAKASEDESGSPKKAGLFHIFLCPTWTLQAASLMGLLEAPFESYTQQPTFFVSLLSLELESCAFRKEHVH